MKTTMTRIWQLIGLFLLSLGLTSLLTFKINAVNIPTVNLDLNDNRGYEEFVFSHLQDNFYP
jgi:hypothetical protein